MKTIQVTQSASAQLAPDSTTVEIRLHSESESYADAAERLHKSTDDMLARLHACGIKKEIKRQSESVTLVRHDGKTSYEGNGSLRLTLGVDDARIEKCVHALEESGAQWRQSYGLTDTSYRDGLIAEAVRAARAAAEVIAAAADVRLGALSSVEYAASYGGGVARMCAVGANAEAEPDTVKVTETVTCAWKIDG